MAEVLCRKKAEALRSLVLYEKLGDLLHTERRNQEAAEAYSKADEKPVDPWHHLRVAEKMAAAYETAQESARALAIYEGLITAYPTNHKVIEFYKHARDLATAMGDATKARSFQAKIDELTAAQQKPAGQQQAK